MLGLTLEEERGKDLNELNKKDTLLRQRYDFDNSSYYFDIFVQSGSMSVEEIFS